MSNLSEIELSNLRHMVIFGQVDEARNKDYAQQSTSPEVKQFFEQAACGAKKNHETIMKFL